MSLSRYIILDTETTSVDTTEAEIIEFAFIAVENGQVIETFDRTLKPAVNPDDFTLALTGLTLTELESSPPPEEILKDFENKYGTWPVIGHNITFDINILNRYLPLYSPPRIDTEKIAQLIWPESSSFSLENLCLLHGIVLTGSHRALDDVISTQNLFTKQLQELKSLPPQLLTIFEKLLPESDMFSGLATLIKSISATSGETGTEELISFIAQNISVRQKEGTQAKTDNQTNHHPLLDYAGKLSGKTLILASQDIFIQLKGTNIHTINTPGYILSDRKLIDLTRKVLTGKAPDLNTFSLAKIIRFAVSSGTGNKDSISLRGKDESSLWFEHLAEDETSCRETPGIFYKSYREQQAGSNIAQAGLGQLIHIPAESLEGFDNVLIYPVESAEREITYGGTLRLPLAEIALTVPDKYNELVSILDSYEDSVEPLNQKDNFKTVFDQIIGELGGDAPRNLLLMSRYISNPDFYFTFNKHAIEIEGEIAQEEVNYSLLCIPNNPKSLLKQFPKITFIATEDLSKDEINLIHHFFGNSTSEILKTEGRPGIKVDTEATPYGQSFFTQKLADYLIKKTAEFGNTTFILSPGAEFAGDFWTKWNLRFKGQPNSMLCIAEGVGGKNSNLEKISRNLSGELVIIGGENFYKSMPQAVKAKIQQVFFTKLSFPNTFSIFGKWRSLQFQNSFLDYSIPHATLMLKSFLLMTRRPDNTYPTVYLTDSRLWQKDYGKEILKLFYR